MRLLIPKSFQRGFLTALILCASLWYAIGWLSEHEPMGSLRVVAPTEGTYEVYRIESEVPLQFVSEQIGKFNEDLPLVPGSYLILADCSSKTVIITPEKTETVVSHEVSFVPPHPPKETDKFSIQCNRYAETRSRQHLTNRYTLHVLEGKRDLLVGMVPMVIDFPAEGNQPRKLSYNLSALQVSSYENMKLKTSFFVSPVGGMIAITEPQEFGQWQFLLPGSYHIEVNGTKMDVALKENEVRTITPAFLRVSAPPHIDLELSSQIRGNPIYVQLNQDHWLDLGEVYPVLPGTVSLRLNGSSEPHTLNLEEGQLVESTTRSVIVSSDCSPWEWACLGNTPIYLYEPGKLYPFAEGVTDVPILFFQDAEILVSVQGSRGLFYKVGAKQQTTSLQLGKVRFIPTPTAKGGAITDLARLEATGAPVAGESLDVIFDRETEMPVIAGTYFFAQYIASNDSDRRRKRDYVTVRPHRTVEIPFTVFVAEKKLAQMEEARKKSEAVRERRNVKKYFSRFHPAIPPKYN